jgi:hypothetical protein
MASIQEIKELLRTELLPITYKLENIESKFTELSKSVEFLSQKYDQLLTQAQSSNAKILDLTFTIQNQKKEISDIQKTIQRSTKEQEDLAQYMRRDCIEITGVQPTPENTCEDIIDSVAELMDLQIKKEDISTAHPLPTHKGPPKIIVKFTRRDIRNQFYNNRRKLAGKKIDKNYVYISESLTPSRKKLFGKVNNIKKTLRWKYIWTNNGKIYLKQSESTSVNVFDNEEGFDTFQSKLDDHNTQTFSSERCTCRRQPRS